MKTLIANAVNVDLDRTPNERKVLAHIRRAGLLTKADITRLTGLSAQSATTIINRLHEDGFLNPLEAVRGKIGQPSTPFELCPDGACSIGIKVGRRSLSVITMSFMNQTIDEITHVYEYPNYERIFEWIREDVTTLVGKLSTAQKQRFVGIGLAVPNMLQYWEGIIGAPKGAMSSWATVDLQSEISELTGFDVYQINDATAACLAEASIDQSTKSSTFLYFYVGTFVGGGMMIDGHVYSGGTGNAAAVGSLPTHISESKNEAPSQLLENASIIKLEALSEAAGVPIAVFTQELALDQVSDKVFEGWVSTAAPALAYSILCGQAFMDTDTVVVDSDLSRELLNRLIERVVESIDDYDLQGLSMPTVIPGTLGIPAKAKGGAVLPMHAKFSPSQKIQTLS